MTRGQLTDDEWGFVEPYLPVGEYGPYPARLRRQFEGVIWKFRSRAQWRDAGVFEALLEGVIAEAAERGGVDLSLVSVDSTTARAHHDAAGTRLEEGVLDALEKAAVEAEAARQKGAARRNKTDRGTSAIPAGANDGASGNAAGSG